MKSSADISGDKEGACRARNSAGRISPLKADIFTSEQSSGIGTPARCSPPVPHRAHHAAVEGSAGTASGFGFTAECLAGKALEPTVIVDTVGPRRFQRMFRRIRETQLFHLAPEFAEQGLELLQHAADDGRPVVANFDVGGRRLPASCRPVLGPSGAVHALQMQIGSPEDSSQPVPLIPLEFDADYLAHFGRPDYVVPEHFHLDRTWTLPALLERVVWIDKRLELIAMFDPFEPASRWCKSLVVDDPVTKVRRHLWMAARAATDQHGSRIVRAVIADLTAVVPAPNHDPLTEHLANRATRAHGSVLMDLRTTLMHSFHCEDDSRIAAWRHRNPQVHPDDVSKVLQAIADLARNRPTRVALRIRFFDDAAWIALQAVCTPLADYARPQANIDFWIDDQT
ncbi:hypothetical protein [Nocardia jiangxiensis]|uniref:hypothetical protein n=1 Tax=Nocardia jiangxiensis TaxID=282685 RepID=UPI0012F6AB13|nr:hypothetical protein [Nocardia jiangxiensis]